MFTGIIEELGKIVSLEKHAAGAKIVVSANVATGDTNDGDSVAVNGVCLTVLDVKPDSFAADVSDETLRRSTIGNLRIGSVVNLERAVTPSTRLGGHIVQGHVDATGSFAGAVPSGDFWTVRINYPKEIAAYLVYKGSISVEGISLTIAELTDEWFEIAVIPKTWQQTNLHALRKNDAVNLEADVIAKYVERILSVRENQKSSGVTLEKLEQFGYK
ncbi:MAG TPA: riboflavin synthase [Pyrinomonadaceae bacterium]|nr:riboflavin synthase [Pyrinomonadaceae bacterium]